MSNQALAGLAPFDLRCEALVDPIGIDALPPRLSWKLESEKPGDVQTGYRILAASSPEKLAAGDADLWDTGKVASDETLWIDYAVKPLKSSGQVWWKLKVWDASGKESAWSDAQYFSMGLLSPSDWKAKWIAAPRISPVVSPHFGFISAASQSAEDVKWLQIDLGQSKIIEGLRLWGTDPCFFPGGGHSIRPGYGFPVRFFVEVCDDMTFASSSVLYDCRNSDFPNPGLGPATLTGDKPLKGRYVRLTATKLFVGWHPAWGDFKEIWQPRPPTTGFMAFAEVEVISQGVNVAENAKVKVSDEPDLSLKALYGWSADRLTDGRTDRDAGSLFHFRPVPQFRREFSAPRAIRRATLYASAMGCYEVYLNGKKVGDQELAPGYQDSPQGLTYQTYDLTRMIIQGDNAVGALLADGWHRQGRQQNKGRDVRIPGYQSGMPVPLREDAWFIGQIEVEYRDGRHEIIATDESWLCHTDGPWRKTSMWDTSVYDSTMEIPGWAEAGNNQGIEWSVPQTREQSEGMPALRAQIMEPIREKKTAIPVTVKETSPGVYLYDFGRSFAGVCRLELDGERGKAVTIRHFEWLDEKGSPYLGSLSGNANNENRIILNGKGMETFQPKFTYNGFRYAEVRGVKPTKIEAVGYASDLQPAFLIETSDPRLNRFCHMIHETYLDNIFGLVIDVSGRDERGAWLGDCFAPRTLSYIFDSAAFKANSADMLFHATDSLDGVPYNRIDPHMLWWGGKSSTVAWSDLLVYIPREEWVSHGNRKVLEDGYVRSAAFVDRIAKENPALILGPSFYRVGFIDWLGSGMTIPPGAKSWEPKGNRIADRDVWGSSWWACSALMTAEMADALGRPEEAERFREMSKGIVSKLLVRRGKDDGSLIDGTQSDYALLLGLGLLDEDSARKAYPHLVAAVKDYSDHLSTGTIITKLLLDVLSKNGDHDLAWKLVMQPTAPSFGTMIDSGSVSIWESLDAWHPELGINPNEKGFSHVGWNSIYEWIVGHVVGLRPDPIQPAFRHFFLEPRVTPGMDWVKASYDSIRGRIECNYRRDGRTVTYDLLVPPNTTATFITLNGAKRVLLSGRHTITDKDEVKK